MTAEIEPLARARLLFFGERALTEGFGLIGVETFPDATVEHLDRVLTELLQSRATALVLLDQRVAHLGSRMLPRVRKEGGRILVTEVPPLRSPEDYHSEIDNQVTALLGGSNLEEG
jgi:vacuolar-type H+-ATPase subunit F/Vma7